jgi:tetratricopeptide (TPR) repeat protein
MCAKDGLTAGAAPTIAAVAITEELLEPYRQADTVVDAERVLDGLVAHGADLPIPIGDLYDELAEAAAEEDDYDLAARLEGKALEGGCTSPVIARQMLGWYLLRSGALEQGERVFGDLRAERPDDVELLITLGHARSDAGLQESALSAFDEAVGVAKRAGLARLLDRARVERKAEREEAGLQADEDDRLAPLPRPMAIGPIAWTLAWFPPTEREAAIRRWPALAADFDHPDGYSRRIEQQLRRLRSALGQRPSVAPIVVEALVEWAGREGHDPESGEARSQYAATLASTGGAMSWPPGRNDACWCRSGQKYKRCCGRN